MSDTDSLPLRALVEASERARATRSRLRKIDAFATLLKRVRAPEIRTVVTYLAGDIPQGKIGMGHATVREAEPGAAASESTLRIVDVDRTLTTIRGIGGKGSKAKRRDTLAALLAKATPDEQSFLVRLLLGALRQGALEGIVVEAVASATELPSAAVRRANMLSGDLGLVAHLALTRGAPGLAEVRFELFRPLQPMLADPAETIDAIVVDGEPLGLEYKLDGARIQAHKDGDRVELYTRNLKPVTVAAPEIVEAVRGLPARRLVLDGEAIALRPDGRPRPFQDTMRRFGRRKHVDAMREQLPLSAKFFDCLLVDDDLLIDDPTSRRWSALDERLPDDLLVPRIESGDVEVLAAFMSRALDDGHEGTMAKRLDAPYEAGRRGHGWHKLKLTHTLDLVVLACEWGSGRRKGWLSNLHLGARDPDEGGFVMLGKTFKGLTDALLTWQTRELLAREIGRDEWCVHVRPELVVEIAFNDVQASPHYPGGLALRFARVKRYREDKRAEEADTIETVRRIFAAGRA